MRVRYKSVQALLVLAVGCCCSNLAQAQGFRVFVEGSASFLLNERFFAAGARGSFRSHYATGGKITIGGEYSLGKMLGLEGAYGYGSNTLRIANVGSPEGSFGVRTQRIIGNAVLHSPVAFLGGRPYATAGLEYDRFAPTSAAKTQYFGFQVIGSSLVPILKLEGASNKIGFNYGGGVEWSLLPALGLRADVRDHVTGTPTYGVLDERSGVSDVSGAAHNVELSVGLTFHIGK